MTVPTRPDLSRQDVEAAMETLRAEGKNPSVARIRSLTGGSDSTIARFKRAIQAEQAPPTNSPEALESFRAVWEKAVQVGNAQREQELQGMREDYDSILGENERLEGLNRTAEVQIEKLRQRQEELQAQLAEAQSQATRARANSENDARQLAEAFARQSALQERCAVEEANLHGQLTEATAKIHEMEVRAAGQTATIEQLKTRSESAECRCSHMEEQKSQVEAQLQTTCVQLSELRAANSELAIKLSDSETRNTSLRKRYDEDFPKLQNALDACTVKCHATELELARLQGQLGAKGKTVVSGKKVSPKDKQPHPSHEKAA